MVEHFELAIDNTRIREVRHSRSDSGRSSSLLSLLTLLAFLLDANLFSKACLCITSLLLRHRQAVTSDGFIAVRGVDNPLVIDLERAFLSTLVQTRINLGAVDVKNERSVRILFRRFNLHTGLHVLGTTCINSISANRNLDELELALAEFLVEFVLLGKSGVNRGVHTDGRHFQRLVGESITNFTFDGTSLTVIAASHSKSDEGSGTNAKFLFHFASSGLSKRKASLVREAPKFKKIKLLLQP